TQLSGAPEGGALPPTPHVLLSYQQDWVRDRAQVKIWEKSRRIGASWTDATDSVLEASAEGGQDALYIGYSEDMAREYIDDCAMWARAFQKAASEVAETVYHSERDQIKAFRLDFDSGRKVLALSSKPRSIRGKQGKVTIDEAAFHDDLAGLIKAAIAMLIWGGRVAILSSHNGEDNAFNLLVKEVRAGKLPYSLHKTDFDQALEAGLYDRVKLILGKRLGYQVEGGAFHEITTRAEWREYIFGKYGESANEELLCVPRQSSGAYLTRAIVERAQVAGVPFVRLAKPEGYELVDHRLAETERWIADVLKPVVDAMPALRTVGGQDFGRDGDLSYFSAFQEYAPGQWREALALELRRIPFDVQQTIIAWLHEHLPLWHHTKLDARGNGQAHAEAQLQKYGPARIECVMATPGWYAANFPPYKAALEDRSIGILQGEDVIADHRRVVLKNGYPAMDAGRDKGADGLYRHGDGAIARVLAWAATRAEGQPPAGERVGRALVVGLPEGMRDRRRAMLGFRRAACDRKSRNT
ncbi:MAG: hypothetical protein ACT4P3_02030, partial [Betaproteobacteria bacterium]